MKWIKAIVIVAALAIPRIALADVCTQSPKQIAYVAVSSATTTELVANGSTTARIIICGYDLTVAGTTPTFQFEYGTGATCGTGTTAMGGVASPTAGTQAHFGDGGYQIDATANGANLCLVTTGTGTPTWSGRVLYVVAP